MSGKLSRFKKPLDSQKSAADQEEYQDPLGVVSVPIERLVPDPENRPTQALDPEDPTRMNENDPYAEEKRRALEELKTMGESFKFSPPPPIRAYRGEGNKLHVIFGHRRFFAAKLAGLERLPAIIDDSRPSNLWQMRSAENENRDPYTTAERVGVMEHQVQEARRRNIPMETAADWGRYLNKDRKTASQYKAVIEGPSDVRAALSAGKINDIAKAAEIAQIKDDDRRTEAIFQAESWDREALRAFRAEATSVAPEPKEKESKKSRGRPATKVNLGSTKETKGVRKIMERCASKEELAKVDWDDPGTVGKAFRAMLKRLEAES